MCVVINRLTQKLTGVQRFACELAVPPNPLELVQRPAFSILMRELLGKFHYVIVDMPAGEHGADAGSSPPSVAPPWC